MDYTIGLLEIQISLDRDEDRMYTAFDDDLEGLLLARSSRFQQLLMRSRESIGLGKGLSRDDFWWAIVERTADKYDHDDTRDYLAR